MKILISLVFSILFTLAVFAQDASVLVYLYFDTETKPTLVEVPLPVYPKAAKKADLQGLVSVAVSIDDEGLIRSADNADGPYPVCRGVTVPGVLELRQAAVDAAKKAVFRPAKLGEFNVWSQGRIIFDFALPEKRVKAEKPEGVKLARSGEAGAGLSSGPGGSSGGLLNQKAIVLPGPKYPAAARAAHAGGSVKVEVLIAEDGTMYSARAVSGDPLLFDSSESAACAARFAPTLLSGKPVKVAGVITYNYVP